MCMLVLLSGTEAALAQPSPVAEPLPPTLDQAVPPRRAQPRLTPEETGGPDGADAPTPNELERRHEEAPGDVDAAYAWGRQLAYDGRYDEALVVLSAALQLAPQYTELRVMRGRVLAWAERWSLATLTLDAILEDAPQDIDALIVRGDVSLWSGDPSTAAIFYERARLAAPDDPRIDGKLLQAYGALTSDDALLAYLRTQPMRDDSSQRRDIRTAAEQGDAPARFDAAGLITFVPDNTWLNGSLSLTSEIRDRVTLGGGVLVQRRSYEPAITDVSLFSPLGIRVSRSVSLSFEGLGTIDPDFAPIWYADAGVFHELIRRAAWSLSMRHSAYSRENVTMVYPSFSVSPWRFTIESTLFILFSDERPTRASGRLKLLYNMRARQRVELWGQVGSEPLDRLAFAITEDPMRVGVLFAVAADARPLSTIRFVYGYSAPLNPTRLQRRLAPVRQTLGLQWTQRFRWRSPYRASAGLGSGESR
jgi:tetratricopeptide (TPR) repeat protein